MHRGKNYRTDRKKTQYLNDSWEKRSVRECFTVRMAFEFPHYLRDLNFNTIRPNVITCSVLGEGITIFQAYK